jgi:hypothetical protein
MACSVTRTLVLSFLLMPALVAQPAPRRPRGIYAVVNVEGNVNQEQKENPSITPAQLDPYFNGLYQDLLRNPAISGLTLQVRWDTLNPNPPASAAPYYWNHVDDAFTQAAAWNGQNPAHDPPTIQLIVTAGFQSPQWIRGRILSCDGCFNHPFRRLRAPAGKPPSKGSWKRATAPSFRCLGTPLIRAPGKRS